MNIHCIEKKETINKIKNGAIWIPCEPEWKKDDIIVFVGDSLIFYERDDSAQHNDVVYARKAIQYSGVSMCAVEIFNAIFETYNEASNINVTLREFEELSKEKLESSILSIVDRVKKHNKIDDIQEKILLELFKGEKTKKQLVEEGCTYQDIDKAYYSFINEMQWCYGFKNSWNTHRAAQFNKGELCFCYSQKKFSKKYSVPIFLVKRIICDVIDGQNILSKDEENFVRTVIENDDYENSISPNKRKDFKECINKIVKYFCECEKEFYNSEAKILIENRVIHIHDIRKACLEKGLNYWRITHTMEKLGVKPNHHIRHRNYLKKLLDEDKK